MKKILSIILLFALVLTLTACESDEYDKSIYVADDHSYLMIHGVKYVRVDGLPISQTDMDRQTIQFKGRIPDSLQKIWDYTGAQRYPWIGLFDEDFYMKDAVLPNGIMIKFVEYAGTYCLPEDLEEVLSLFEDFKWSSDKAGLYLIDPNISYQLSDSLSKYILNSVENNAKKNVDRIVKDRHFLSEVGVVYDSKLCVEKQFYRVCFFPRMRCTYFL